MPNSIRERLVVSIQGVLRLGTAGSDIKIEFAEDDIRSLKNLLEKVDNKKIKLIVSNVEERT